MGQYGNQPDFATRVENCSDIGEYPINNIKSAAIYIGSFIVSGSPASITVIPVGNETEVTFTGLSAGTFLPVIVSSIVSAVNIREDKVLLIY